MTLPPNFGRAVDLSSLGKPAPQAPATVAGACGAGFPRDERSTARPKFGGSVIRRSCQSHF